MDAQRHLFEIAGTYDLIDALSEPVWHIDASCQIVHINPAAWKLLRKNPTHTACNNLKSLGCNDETAARVEECWQQALENGSPCHTVFKLPVGDDARVIHARFNPVWNADGEPIGLVGWLQEPAKQKLRFLDSASGDALFGLPDRRGFITALQEVLHARPSEVLIIVLKVRAFDSIIEMHGVDSAGIVLQRIVSRLQSRLRDGDHMARLDRDTIGIVIGEGASSLSNDDVVSRIVRQFDCSMIADSTIDTVNCSIGLRRWHGESTEAETLVENAELALARALAYGQAWCIYRSAGQDDRPSGPDLLEALRQGIERDELFLQYQPQVALLTGEIVGAEALVRWQHPVRGLVPPGEFIPLAEGTELIEDIGEWVLRSACKQVQRWRQADLKGFRLGINLSSRHFRRSDLVGTVAAMIKELSLDPTEIELEITESALMDDIEGTIATLNALKGLGVRIALDDFGTGYSSLAYLSRLPIDTLKIDRAFVSDVVQNPVNAAIATATIAMGHSLGKTVIAEGVETEAQLSWLRRKNCDEIQGFLFSPPLSVDDFTDKLFRAEHLQVADPATDRHPPTVLLVDDEPNVLNALQRRFFRDGYRILAAQNAERALEVMALHHVHVVISDQGMPGMTGTEFLSRVKDLYPDTVRMVLSGTNDMETVTEAINRGAIWKYFVKPCDFELLRENLKLAFRNLNLTGLPQDGSASRQH